MRWDPAREVEGFVFLPRGSSQFCSSYSCCICTVSYMHACTLTPLQLCVFKGCKYLKQGVSENQRYFFEGLIMKMMIYHFVVYTTGIHLFRESPKQIQ